MIALKLLLAFLALALLVWIRAGRPGTGALPPRLRPWARRFPFLAGPALVALALWRFLRPTAPWGGRAR